MNRSTVSRARFFPAALFIGIAIMMAACFMFSFKSRSGERISREDAPFADLPDNAEQISYYIPGLLGHDLYLDFTTTEEAFYVWVEGQQGTTFEKQAEGAFQIDRFNFDTGKGQTIRIEDGVLFAWREDPKGVFMGYDRIEKRAYFHSRAK